MQIRGLVIYYVGPLITKLVYYLAYHFLISRNGRRGNYNFIAGRYFNLLVSGKRHSVKGAHSLALGTGCNNNNFFLRIAFYLVYIHKGIFRYFHISALSSHSDDIFHAAAGYGHLPSVLGRGIYNLLHSVYV